MNKMTFNHKRGKHVETRQTDAVIFGRDNPEPADSQRIETNFNIFDDDSDGSCEEDGDSEWLLKLMGPLINTNKVISRSVTMSEMKLERMSTDIQHTDLKQLEELGLINLKIFTLNSQDKTKKFMMSFKVSKIEKLSE